MLSVQCSVLSGRFCVCFRCPEKWSRGVVCVWPRTNSIVSIIIWFCYLEWMIYGGELIWCDLLTSKICQVEETVLVSVRIFVNKININRCKRWYYGPRAKLSIFFLMLRVSMVSSHLDLQLLYCVGIICTDITPTNSRAKTIWRLEIILRSILIKKRARNIPQ